MENTQNIEFDPHTLKADIGRAGLTISQICEKSGVTAVTFSNWVKGSKPQPAKLKMFMNAFNQLKEN